MEHFCSSNGKYSTLMPVHYEKRQFAKEKHNVKVTFLFVFIKLLNERILPQEDLKMAEESHVRLPS
jgi:hypothetical protein